MPDVGQEILDLIIDELDGDSKALIACASTSRSLLPRAQYHIFSRISFAPPYTLTALYKSRLNEIDLRICPLHQFHATVQRTPRIASYVKELDILEGVGCNPWIEKSSAVLCDALSHLKSVRRFSLGRWTGAFLKQIKEAVWHFLHRCPVRHVTLNNSTIPTSIFEACLTLDSVRLYYSFPLIWGQLEAAFPVCAPKSMRLRKLSVTGLPEDNGIVRSLLNRFLDATFALDASSVRHLYLTLNANNDVELSTVASFLQLCPSLEEFEFRGRHTVDIPFQKFNQFVDVGCCSRLRVIKLFCMIESPDTAPDDYQDPIPALLELLTRVRSSIEVAHLSFIPRDMGDSLEHRKKDVRVAKSYARCWEALDSLASPTFPRLRDANFFFRTWYRLSRNTEECIRSHMPGLSGSGRLQIQYHAH